MNHRHLLPNEIDLLVDGEAGFGVAPLRAHIDECGECRELLEEGLFVAEALESLPHFAPDSRLSDRVMAQVPVFVPAHVAARDSVMRWLPQAGAARAAAAVLLTVMGGAFTVALVWLATMGDAFVFISQLLGERLQHAVGGAIRDVAVAMLGESMLASLQSIGAIGISLLAGGFLLTAVGAVVGLRRLATAPVRS